jgi:hypothetical protein
MEKYTEEQHNDLLFIDEHEIIEQQQQQQRVSGNIKHYFFNFMNC